MLKEVRKKNPGTAPEVNWICSGLRSLLRPTSVEIRFYVILFTNQQTTGHK